MKKIQSIVLSLSLLTLLFSACAPTPATPIAEAPAVAILETTPVTTEILLPNEIVIVDALDRQITLSESPSRIAYGGRSSLMIADVLYLFPGIHNRIVSVGDTNQNFGNFTQAIDPTYDQKTMISGQANIEEFVANNPDVILLKNYLAKDYQQPLEDLGIPTVFLDLETADHFNQDILMMGDLLGQPERAQEIVETYNQSVANIRDTVASLSEEEKPRVLVLYYKESDGAYTYNVPPQAWMQTTNVITAGGIPVWLENAATDGWNMIGFEQIAAWNADQIYLIAYRENSSDLVATLLEDPQWQSLKAVQNGQVYGFPGDFYSWDQPDTRWILGLKWLAWRMHPDLFPTFNTLDEVRKFYKDLYLLDDALIDSAIIPLLRGDYTD
jgi:iron complex transport system substrate-binding protein